LISYSSIIIIFYSIVVNLSIDHSITIINRFVSKKTLNNTEMTRNLSNSSILITILIFPIFKKV